MQTTLAVWHSHYTRKYIVTVVDIDFALFCLNTDIRYEVIPIYSYLIKADSDYTLRVLLVSCVKKPCK